MKSIIAVMIIAISIIACSKKTVPVITERKNEPAPTIVSAYPPPASIIADTVIGKEIFITRCGRCHGLHSPAEFTFKRWDGILTTMVPKARLTAEQSAHITAYIKANAGK